MKSTKEEIWNGLLAEHSIKRSLEELGYFRISSSELNAYSRPRGGPDARNLVKFDSSDRLPAALRGQRLSFLPTATGKFVVGPFACYLQTTEEDSRRIAVESLGIGDTLESLPIESLTSESAALMAAQSAGMLSDFLAEKVTHTGFGKSSTDHFEFDVNRLTGGPLNISVEKGTAMEIDGVYESSTAISIIEAKAVQSRDFHVRQLYYPLRALRVRHSKPIRAVLLKYHAGIFDLREILWEDSNNLSSFRQGRHKRYSIGSTKITRAQLLEICGQNPTQAPPLGVSFPQADKFEKIIFLLENLKGGELSKSEIGDLFGYVARQGDYYARAGMYLRLVQKRGTKYLLTTKGASIVALSGIARSFALCKTLLEVPSIRLAFEMSAKSGASPSKAEMVQLMRSTNGSNEISQSTEPRRANTALDWLDWIFSKIDA